MRHGLFLITLFLSPALAGAQAAEPSAGGPPPGLRIGAVNIVRVFDELEEKVDMNAELRQLEEKRGTKLRELGERARNLDEKAKLLKPDSEEGRSNAKLLEEASSEYRSYRDATEDHLYNKLYDFTLGIYKKIRDEVQVYAREAGYDIVLRTRDAEIGDLDQTLRPRTRYLELNRRIEAQSVLFHNPAFDFTNAIIKRLNEKYQHAKAEKEKLQPTPAPEPKPKSSPEPKLEPKLVPDPAPEK